jgi:oligopeptidase B
MQEPIAQQKLHKVYLGNVDGESRGNNPMNPPIEMDDPYFWLRDDDRENPEVLDWIKKENEYFDQKYEPLKQFSEQIYNEHISHLKEDDVSVPVIDGPYLYYERTAKGKSYKINCRMKKELLGNKNNYTVKDIESNHQFEEIILDENELAKNKPHCDVGDIEPSPDHTIIAYSVDFKGEETFEINFISPDNKIKDKLRGSLADTIVWGKDNSRIFYISKNKENRHDKIWCHVLGTPMKHDILLFNEDDELFNVGCYKTLNNNYLIIDSGSSETTESYILDLQKFSTKDTVNDSMQLVRKKEFGVRYSIEGFKNDDVYILTNGDDCINNKLVKAPFNQLDDWNEIVIDHNIENMIDNVEIFDNFMVIEGRRNGLTQIWTIDRDGIINRVETEDEIYEISLSENNEINANSILINYSSLRVPDMWFNYNPESREKFLVKQKEIIDYNPNDYVCYRLYATSVDKTKIPLSVIRKKDLDMNNQTHPTLLYGYGSYGICNDPHFNRKIIPLISRNVIYCIAHIRGGGEMGREWYEVGGKYLTKRNTFQDFISSAEELINSGITSPDKLAIEGRSAGGLLMGTVTNMRPDLFKVVVAGVPFVDVMTTMCDPSIPLTTEEWEEWGNPNEAKYYDYMLSYSPINNVRNQSYPNILITAGLHDPRVGYWEPLKWASVLRSKKANNNDVLLKIDTDCGHFSASDRYYYLRDTSTEQAYVLKMIVG